MTVFPVTLSLTTSFITAIELLGNPSEMFFSGTQYALIGKDRWVQPDPHKANKFVYTTDELECILNSSYFRSARHPRCRQAVLPDLLQDEPNQLLRIFGSEI